MVSFKSQYSYMNLTSRLLLVLVVLITSSSFVLKKGEFFCDDLKVTSEFVSTSLGKNNGKFSVKVSGGQKPYVFVFVNDKHKPISTIFNENKIGDLSAGKYYCSIYDKNGCSKVVNVLIK